MRHRKKGRKLKRTASHRRALLTNLAVAALANGKIATTLAKAKEARRAVERLVSFGKRGDLHARRQAARVIRDKAVLARLFNEVGPSFAGRAGGYTRIVKLGRRSGDGAETCLLQIIGVGPGEPGKEKKKRQAQVTRRPPEAAREHQEPGSETN